MGLQTSLRGQLPSPLRLSLVQPVPPGQRLCIAQHQLDVLQHRERFKSLRHLKGTGHAQALALCGRFAQKRLALPQHLARRGHLLARQTGETGRLSRPIGANQGHALASRHFKVHTIECPHPTKMLGQAMHLKRRGGFRIHTVFTFGRYRR